MYVRSPPGPRYFIDSCVGLYVFPCARASHLNKYVWCTVYQVVLTVSSIGILMPEQNGYRFADDISIPSSREKEIIVFWLNCQWNYFHYGKIDKKSHWSLLQATIHYLNRIMSMSSATRHLGVDRFICSLSVNCYDYAETSLIMPVGASFIDIVYMRSRHECVITSLISCGYNNSLVV